MKLAGCAIVILATTLLGMKKAEEWDAAYEEMKYFRQILLRLESEIRYAKVCLADVFLNVSKSLREPYNTWFQQMSMRLEQKKEGGFIRIWSDTIDIYLKEVNISEKQKNQIKELGNYLGSLDISMQMKQIQLLNEQLELAMQELRDELEGKKKICRCLGVMSGIFIAILLI
jgi:stage III sporulation protein AB